MKMNAVRSCVKYWGFFLLFYVLMCAEISGVRPFCFGMLFALVWNKQKAFLLAPLYLLAGYLVFFDIGRIFIDLITVFIVLITFLLHYYFKKPLNKILIGCYAFLSQFGLLYMSTANPESLWQAFLTLILGLICLYCYLNLFSNFSLKGIRGKLRVDEIACLFVLVFGLGAGIMGLPFSQIYVFGIIALAILLANYLLGTYTSLVGAIFLGLGVSFAGGNFLYLSHIVFIDLFVALGQSNKRVFSVLLCILIDVISGLYFLNKYSLGQFLSVVVAGCLFLALPKGVLLRLKNCVIVDKEEYTVRSLINREKQEISGKLYSLGEVFCELDRCFRGLMTADRDFEKNKTYFVNEVRRKNCSACPKREECKAWNESIFDAVSGLFDYAFRRGKVSLIDVPQILSSKCERLSLVLGSINMLVDEYKSAVVVEKNLNAGKKMLAEQMGGIGNIMQNLADEMGVEVSFDMELERNLREELLYSGVQCGEVIFSRKGQKIFEVTLVVRTCDSMNKGLSEVVSWVLNVFVEVVSVSADKKPGFSVVVLQKINNYDMIFGVASRPHAGNDKSGDTYSLLKLDKSRILLSLCDGMGSGEKANRASSMALSMVESFYKAGFNHELILQSANQMLSIADEESFSAMDICVVDLEAGVCDLIKIGSPFTLLKAGAELREANSSTLPLGILPDFRPNVANFVLVNGEMIVLMTDGVVDSFSSLDEVRKLVVESDTLNPQELANFVLNSALDRCKNYPEDDMTVLVGKIFLKV